MEGLGLRHLFGGTYAGTRVLVTGHTGFKGSWLCLWLQALGAEVCGLSLPPETSPAHWPLLALDVEERSIDLRDAGAVRDAVAQWRPRIVFHLAAQSLVRRSYAQPVETFATNVGGLVNLLEALRACESVQAVVNATTDKVYREPPPAQGYAEDHPLGGHDPYSTSKACAELVSDCYRKSWFAIAGTPRLATARAGNVTIANAVGTTRARSAGAVDWAKAAEAANSERTADASRRDQPCRRQEWVGVFMCVAGVLAAPPADTTRRRPPRPRSRPTRPFPPRPRHTHSGRRRRPMSLIK